MFGFIKKLVKDNLYNKDTGKGFLFSELHEYNSCLDFNLEKMERLLKQDDVKWTSSVDEKKLKVEKLREKFKVLLAM